jgi:hypothetical protein
MTRTVNIELYCTEDDDDGRDVFAVVTEHRPDLPQPFDEQLQSWAESAFSHIQIGESIEKAGELVYKPDEYIIHFRKYTQS